MVGLLEYGGERRVAPDNLGLLGRRPRTLSDPTATSLLIGEHAQGADLDALARARAMAAAGADRGDIWRATHWFQAPDEQWKSEISDGDARWTGPNEDNWTSSSVLTPEPTGDEAARLKAMALRLNRTLMPSEVTRQTGYGIYGGRPQWDMHETRPPPGLPTEGPLSSMLDHPALYRAYPALADTPTGVFRKEGSIGAAGSPVDGLYGPGAVQIWGGRGTYDPASIPDDPSMGIHALSTERTRSIGLHETQHAISRAEGWPRYGSDYQHSIWEADARVAQARRNLTPEQLQKFPPYLNYDVPEDSIRRRQP